MCNTKSFDYDVSLTKREVVIKMDHETTREVAEALAAGATASGIIAILTQAGVVSAPPGWLAAILGAVLTMLATDLALHMEGCGVVVEIWQYTPSALTFYEVKPQ